MGGRETFRPFLKSINFNQSNMFSLNENKYNYIYVAINKTKVKIKYCT